MNDKRIFRPIVSIWLQGSKPFFGAGCARLLRDIQECGNVAAACTKMQLSYSKGRKMIRAMEAEVGRPVVNCVKGGPEGGAAHVTAEGEHLLAMYDQYKKEICQYADSQFDAIQVALVDTK